MSATVQSKSPYLSSPPAVWAAFARQGAWKSWVMLGQLGVIALLVMTNTHLAGRAPDVVLVQPDGKSTYVPRSVVGDAILQVIQETKGQPGDVTVAHFSKEFLQDVLAVNSTTIEATWNEALSVMAPPLRSKLSKEYSEQKVLEALRLARVKTNLDFESLELVERTDALLHVRAIARRTRMSLITEGAPEADRVQVELVLGLVSRSQTNPDGLQVRDYSIQVLKPNDSSAVATEGKHAP